MNGTTQCLIGVNVELKDEIEKMRKVAEETVVEAQKRTNEIVISHMYICWLDQNNFPYPLWTQVVIDLIYQWETSEEKLRERDKYRRKKSDEAMVANQDPHQAQVFLFYLGVHKFFFLFVRFSLLGDRCWWWSPILCCSLLFYE